MEKKDIPKIIEEALIDVGASWEEVADFMEDFLFASVEASYNQGQTTREWREMHGEASPALEAAEKEISRATTRPKLDEEVKKIRDLRASMEEKGWEFADSGEPYPIKDKSE